MNALLTAPLFAGMALGFALFALYVAGCMRSTVHALPRPFWMGAAPKPGDILDTRYRYDHILHTFDWLRPGEKIDIGGGEVLEVAAKRTGFPHQPPEQAGRSEHIQATCGVDIDAAGVVNLCIQLVADERAPDGDAGAGLQTEGQPHQLVRVAIDWAANEFCLEDVSRSQAAWRQANTIDGDRHEPMVDDAKTEPAIRIRFNAPSVRAGATGHLPVLHLSVTAMPQRDKAQPNAITAQRPPGVDDTEHSAQRSAGDGQGTAPVDAAKPRSQGHDARSPVVPAASIAESNAGDPA